VHLRLKLSRQVEALLFQLMDSSVRLFERVFERLQYGRTRYPVVKKGTKRGKKRLKKSA